MNEDKLYSKVVLILEKLKPFIAIFVLIFIVLSTIGLYNHNKLNKEVKESCGFELDEDVYCVCDKNFVSGWNTPYNPYYNSTEEDFNASLIIVDDLR